MSDPWGPSPWGAAEPEPEPEPDETSIGGLIELMEKQAALIVSVGTGGDPIANVNGKYKARRSKLNAGMRKLRLKPPFPWDDLWEWYGYYSQNLGTYAERRIHVAGLTKPVREQLERMLEGAQVADPGGTGPATTWGALDSRVEGVVSELWNANTVDDLQDVGRRCREILIDTAKLLADPALVPAGATAPKAADAKAWLDLFLAAEAAGSERKELRAFIRVAWDLAQKVTHGTVERVEAYAAAQATVLVVRSLQQLA